VGLADHIDKYPDALSCGQKQRVGIARALANGPKMILADEPTASLDKESGRNVVNLIQELCGEQGASVAMADDNMDDQARETIRRILVEQSDLEAVEVDLVMEMAMSASRSWQR
tara:strand:- start:6151 stop:6492 length:342 start_codon:yes stop_codon:yes gene_type:complete